jgi:hypothetical protein
MPRSAAALRSPLAFQDDRSTIKLQFGLSGTGFNSTGFAIISSQGNLPRKVQAALKLFF